jgi:riboflavin synthase
VFTGIVEEIGTVRTVARKGDVTRLDLAARLTLEGSEVGASVAVSGVCLTVVERGPDGLVFEMGPETLARTSLGTLRAGSSVNLERPLRFGGALGGHLVLGHVDGTGTVEAVSRVESTARVRIAFHDRGLAPLALLDDAAFEVMLIPHTLAVTTLGRLSAGQPVNVETDVIGKYVQRSLVVRGV